MKNQTTQNTTTQTVKGGAQPKAKSASATAHRNYVQELYFLDKNGALTHPCEGDKVGNKQRPRHAFATKEQAQAMLDKVKAQLGGKVTTTRIYATKEGYTAWATTKPIQNIRGDRYTKNEARPTGKWWAHEATANVLTKLGATKPEAPKAEAPKAKA